jgi:hypothetical protein
MSNMIYERKDGLLIIKPHNYKLAAADCSICGFALRHQEDIVEHKNFGSCLDCSLIFRQPNKEKWQQGWRPTGKEVMNRIINNNQEN